MGKDKASTGGKLFNFRGVRIEKRLKKAFNIVSVISVMVSIVGLIAIIVVTSNFRNAMENYALPQGDIALFMNEYAECRSNMRGIIGYDDKEFVNNLIEKHDIRKEKTYERLAAIEKTMVTPEGKAAYSEIEKALDAYFVVEAEVISLGTSGNSKDLYLAQKKAFDDVAPVYDALDAATLHLMDINIEKENGTTEYPNAQKASNSYKY